jgi:hypothetical protein
MTNEEYEEKLMAIAEDVSERIAKHIQERIREAQFEAAFSGEDRWLVVFDVVYRVKADLSGVWVFE